jgi:plasmid maintenance system antidote protein VapI
MNATATPLKKGTHARCFPHSGDSSTDQSNRLLDALLERLQLKNDAALSRYLEVTPTLLSKLRHGNLQISPAFLLRAHDVTDISIVELRAMMMASVDEDANPVVKIQVATKGRLKIENYHPNNILDALSKLLGVRSDAELAKILDSSAPVVSRIRRYKCGISGDLLIKMHEVSKLSIQDLRTLMAGKTLGKSGDVVGICSASRSSE